MAMACKLFFLSLLKTRRSKIKKEEKIQLVTPLSTMNCILFKSLSCILL